MIYPDSLQKLINSYKKLPGIGEKSAERLALSTLDFTEEDIKMFSESLTNAKASLKKCSICGHLTDKDVCNICSDESRDKNLICVIEDYKSVFAFEKVGNYRGTYHVLNGLISPMDNISIEKKHPKKEKLTTVDSLIDSNDKINQLQTLENKLN